MKKFLVVNERGEYYASMRFAPIGPRVVTPEFVSVERAPQEGVQVMLVLEDSLEALDADFSRHGIKYTLIPV